MPEVRTEFTTKQSVQECANTFRNAVKGSYGASRKLLRVASSMRGGLLGGGGEGGIEFFVPSDTPFSQVDGSPDWMAGAYVPGYSKLHGATRMAVHIYVVDEGHHRVVQLVGPYGMGERGSTERLVKTIASSF
jgi:hypothetical protein